MKKKQKDNLIKAFEELNTPDKDVLLQKIEGKKALGGEWAKQEEKAKKARRRNRVAWTSFACSVVVIAIVVILISSSIFGGSTNAPTPDDGSNIGGSNIGAGIIDYRNSWKFTLDNNISFDGIDKTIKDLGIDLIYDYKDDWAIVETEVTQDESAYREYYVKDDVTVEVTVLLKGNVTSMDGRYYAILSGGSKFISGNYAVYSATYTVNKRFKQAYVIYLKDQVYIFTSDVDLRYMFR
ncbi:MAG: hypothetical protein K2L70_03695 [Clostridia bacterium]|nr:hypothetical protein [Clostridia bacterium]